MYISMLKLRIINGQYNLTREIINLTALGKSKPREFGKIIKSQYKKQSTSSNNLNITELFDHFKQLFTNDDDTNNDNQHEHINDNVNNNDDDLDQTITITERSMNYPLSYLSFLIYY